MIPYLETYEMSQARYVCRIVYVSDYVQGQELNFSLGEKFKYLRNHWSEFKVEGAKRKLHPYPFNHVFKNFDDSQHMTQHFDFNRADQKVPVHYYTM